MIYVIRPYRHIVATVLAAAVVALAIGAASASAAGASSPKKSTTPCWKTLINDWYDGRIDGTYAIHCYRDALKHLPTDVETYSSARDDIKQALQKRLTQGTSGGTTTTTKSGQGGGAAGGSSGGGSGPAGPSGSGSGSSSGPAGTGSGAGSGGKSASGPFGSGLNALKPAKADSLPIPLLVLGGIAVLLMAAGGAGFLARRMRLRKLQLAALPKGAAIRPPEQP